MTTFAEVKNVLDTLASTHDIVRMKQKHGGAAFNWDTAENLRNAVAKITGATFRLIAPEFVGNGKADNTYLVRLLSGPIDEENLPQMPFRGPAASNDQIKIVRNWINEGALDDNTDCTA